MSAAGVKRWVEYQFKTVLYELNDILKLKEQQTAPKASVEKECVFSSLDAQRHFGLRPLGMPVGKRK